ncbi:MAG: cytochrome b [Ottowia sp.]|uniref:cytochrome b n=1 Tax=unclassified Ottowia TaxID=2645081 RepID=UPI003C306563
MSIRNLDDRYSPWVIGFHWLTLGLLIVIYASMELRGLAPKGSEMREAFKSFHFLLGLCLLLVVVVRVGVRWQSGAAPGIQPPMPEWQTRLASLFHYALYAFLIAMPILGWLVLSAKGEPIILFGLSVPSLIGPDKALSRQIKEVHETLATVGYFLIGLHAAAALLHHYVVHDNTLVRMLPGRRSSQKP